MINPGEMSPRETDPGAPEAPAEQMGMLRARGCVCRRARPLAIAGWLVLVLAAGCRREETPAAEVTVQAAKPEAGPLQEHIEADGILAPLAQAAIAPRISAPVKRFYVERGARVRRGQLLAVLENADLKAAVLDNRGAYQAAQAAYATATRAQVPEDAQRARLDLAQARANLELNRSIVKSRTELFREGAIPGRDLDTAQAALVQAQAAYDAASTHLQSVERVSREAALRSAEGQLTSAEGRMKGADAQVGYSEIRSPISGVVTERPLFAGETAAAGTPLVTVMDTSTLLAKAHLAHDLVAAMKVGDPAEVRVPGTADTVRSRIFLISPALDPGSTTVEVWLRLDNREGRLRVGTPVKLLIAGRAVASALRIPAAAVLAGPDGQRSVMVAASDGLAHRRTVTLGISDGEDVEVRSGLSRSDLVITGGAYGLDEGTRVRVGPAGGDDERQQPAGGPGAG